MMETNDGDWQDISTAPKAGLIDLWLVWTDGSQNRAADAFWNAEKQSWQCGQFSLSQYTDKGVKATHWMLPPVAPGASPMTDTATILNRAADRLEKPGAWTQGADARREDGRTVFLHSQFATAWSARGAIFREGKLGAPAAMRVFRQHLGEGVISFNDAPGRTQSEVVTALRDAAKMVGGV